MKFALHLMIFRAPVYRKVGRVKGRAAARKKTYLECTRQSVPCSGFGGQKEPLYQALQSKHGVSAPASVLLLPVKYLDVVWRDEVGAAPSKYLLRWRVMGNRRDDQR